MSRVTLGVEALTAHDNRGRPLSFHRPLRAALVALLFTVLAGSSTATATDTAAMPDASTLEPNRLIVRFDRKVFEPTPEDVRLAIASPTQSALSTVLRNPKSVRRLIGRDPTAFELKLLRDFPNTPEARLTQYFVLDYDDENARLLAESAIKADARFEYVARDARVSTRAAVPADLYYSSGTGRTGNGQYQWGMFALRFPDALDKVTGTALVGVMDGGVSPNHPDLLQNVRPQFSRNFTAAGFGPQGAQFPNDLSDEVWGDLPSGSVPSRGHGTHVAGIIAAAWDGGVGVAGGCPDCSLAIAKDSAPTGAALASALNFLIDSGIQVVNMSFENPGISCSTAGLESFCDALAKAAAADVVVVAAAGNRRSSTLPFPASIDGVVAAGGLQIGPSGYGFWEGRANLTRVLITNTANGAVQNPPPNDVQLNYPFGSSYSSKLKLLAPATEVLSTIHPNAVWSPFATPDEHLSSLDETFTYVLNGQNRTISTGPASSVGWGTMSGTSMAAPHVAALAGLVRTANPLTVASSIESLLQTTGSQDIAHDGRFFTVPDAGAAVDDTLGGETTVNRLTAMFSFWSVDREEHFYTVAPQVANAALRGTLLPAASGGAYTFRTTGNFVLDPIQFPAVMCDLSPCFAPGDPFVKPRALFNVWVGYRNPYYPAQQLKALFRLSKAMPNGSTKHAYAVDFAERNEFVINRGYQFDGVEGFVVGAGQTQPPGTVRLCRKTYAGPATNRADDFMLFLDDSTSGPVCAQNNDCYAPNGNCGINVVYSEPLGLPLHIGYVVPTFNSADDDQDSLPYGLEISEGRNPNAKDNDIFTLARLFAFQQSFDWNYRLAGEGEVSSLASLLSSGQLSRTQSVQNHMSAAEHFNVFAPIIRLYRAYFVRFPDFGGLDYWTRQFRFGVPPSSISQNFASSQEFQQATGGLSNAGFITYCYQVVLGRQPDSGGYNYWLGQLDSGARNRGEVMLAFSESAEYQAASLNRVWMSMLYHGMFRRTPDQGGYDFWLGQLDAGWSLDQVIPYFFYSTEYRLRFLPS